MNSQNTQPIPQTNPEKIETQPLSQEAKENTSNQNLDSHTLEYQNLANKKWKNILTIIEIILWVAIFISIPGVAYFLFHQLNLLTAVAGGVHIILIFLVVSYIRGWHKIFTIPLAGMIFSILVFLTALLSGGDILTDIIFILLFLIAIAGLYLKKTKLST